MPIEPERGFHNGVSDQTPIFNVTTGHPIVLSDLQAGVDSSALQTVDDIVAMKVRFALGQPIDRRTVLKKLSLPIVTVGLAGLAAGLVVNAADSESSQMNLSPVPQPTLTEPPTATPRYGFETPAQIPELEVHAGDSWAAEILYDDGTGYSRSIVNVSKDNLADKLVYGVKYQGAKVTPSLEITLQDNIIPFDPDITHDPNIPYSQDVRLPTGIGPKLIGNRWVIKLPMIMTGPTGALFEGISNVGAFDEAYFAQTLNLKAASMYPSANSANGSGEVPVYAEKPTDVGRLKDLSQLAGALNGYRAKITTISSPESDRSWRVELDEGGIVAIVQGNHFKKENKPEIVLARQGALEILTNLMHAESTYPQTARDALTKLENDFKEIKKSAVTVDVVGHYSMGRTSFGEIGRTGGQPAFLRIFSLNKDGDYPTNQELSTSVTIDSAVGLFELVAPRLIADYPNFINQYVSLDADSQQMIDVICGNCIGILDGINLSNDLRRQTFPHIPDKMFEKWQSASAQFSQG